MVNPLSIPGIPYAIGRANRLVRDKLRRDAVAAFEVDRALYKAIVSDQSLPYGARQQVQRLFETELPRDSAAVRVRSRCALTGRGRSVFSFFRLSRIMFRTFAKNGMLPGVKKASW
jgi:small subunit ribosomal protein S14